MKLKITVEGMGQISLTDKNYLAAGGEASVYVKDRTAFKIYHDASQMIPLTKIAELGKISAKNVLKPKRVVRDSRNKPIGYTMQYIKTTHPLCKLFTKAFQQKNGISHGDIANLVKAMQLTVQEIHGDNCLIVDFNEMNLLVSRDFRTPYFIDVDSYQTPSHRATAIMESIRDRLVKNNQFTQESDWFSFAVLAFQLYIGIHPYKGKHPKYKASEWGKRMDDGVSVFDKDVTLPRVCHDLSVIPKTHREWFEAVFMRNERSVPPLPDVVVTVVPVSKFVTESTADFDAIQVAEYQEAIQAVYNFMGINYVLTPNGIYKDHKMLPVDVADAKVLMASSNGMSPVVAKLKDETLAFEDLNGDQFAVLNADNVTGRNGAIYSIYRNNLTESTFDRVGNKVVHKTRIAANVSDLSTTAFDGVFFQDLLGKQHITLPYDIGKCITVPVKELNGFRLIDAKSEGNVCVVMAEKRGKYYRFVLIFDEQYRTYTVTRSDDIAYSPINFTVLPNGVCIMVVDSDVQVFKGKHIKVASDPPFDANSKLFNASGSVFFMEGGRIYQAKSKTK